jgi:5-amino-6-(5-phosphoribosylamino)uracil reductase
MSLDGYIDDASPERLVLSNDEDLDRVDAVRASCDAIMVGAGTIRADNPRLLIKSAVRRAQRREAGRPGDPTRVTLTAGDLDPEALFLTMGGLPDKIVYCASPAFLRVQERVGHLATVVDGGDPVKLTWLLRDLAARGVRRLMVEGGSQVLTQVLTGGLADELHVVVAPFFVGDPAAPRFVAAGRFPFDLAHPMALAEVRTMGDRVLLHYMLGER